MHYPIIPGHVSVGRILEAPGVDEDALGEPLSQGDVVTFGVGVGPLDAAPNGRGEFAQADGSTVSYSPGTRATKIFAASSDPMTSVPRTSAKATVRGPSSHRCRGA